MRAITRKVLNPPLHIPKFRGVNEEYVQKDIFLALELLDKGAWFHISCVTKLGKKQFCPFPDKRELVLEDRVRHRILKKEGKNCWKCSLSVVNHRAWCGSQPHIYNKRKQVCGWCCNRGFITHTLKSLTSGERKTCVIIKTETNSLSRLDKVSRRRKYKGEIEDVKRASALPIF